MSPLSNQLSFVLCRLRVREVLNSGIRVVDVAVHIVAVVDMHGVADSFPDVAGSVHRGMYSLSRASQQCLVYPDPRLRTLSKNQA